MASSVSIPSPEVYSRDQHPISRHNIDADALKIMYRLIRHGYKAYLVGGSVRDLLLDKKPKDFDIVTDATPRKIKVLFRNSRIIGRRFKLVHVFFGKGKIIEVSTFRDVGDPIGTQEEEAGTQRLSDNKYGTEVTDAFRRDITINALFYDLKNFSLIDYVGGIRDLTDGIIRVIGDPHVRYKEDPVRMLRVIRHAARTDFRVEEHCWKAIATNHRLLLKSPPMRLFEELKKDFSSGYLLNFLRLLAKTDLLALLLPELTQAQPSLYENKSLLTRVLTAIDEKSLSGSPPPPAVVLSLIIIALRDNGSAEHASFFADLADLTAQIQKSFSNLAVPRRERERMQEILSSWYYLATTPPDKIKPAKVLQREYAADLRVFLELSGARPWMLEVLQEGHRKGSRTRPQHHRPKPHLRRHGSFPPGAKMRARH